MGVSVQPSSETNGSVPPHNLEAETSVLGAVLLTEQALDGILLEVGLRADDFYRPRHQLIFGSMVQLKEKAEPEAVDALTVSDHLKRAGQLDEAGGEGYVHSLPTEVPAVGNVLHYARIVKEYALLRRVLVATRDCATAIAKVHDAAGAEVNSALTTATVGNVKVTGATATATLSASGHTTSVGLAKQGGSWKLTSFPGI